jgi:hypothetical protein
MPEYRPDTIEAVWKVLRGLNHSMNVDIEPGVPLAAKPCGTFVAPTTWLPGLSLRSLIEDYKPPDCCGRDIRRRFSSA